MMMTELDDRQVLRRVLTEIGGELGGGELSTSEGCGTPERDDVYNI
jgi:hypothetical protein